jgi:hypothetical protein
VARRVHVVDDVDAAHERDRAVDHRELAVHATQAMPADVPGIDVGPEDEHADLSGREHVAQAAEKALRAEAVDDHLGAHAARHRGEERPGDAPAGDVVSEDVSLEVDRVLRRLDRRLECREVLGAAPQEREPVLLAKGAAHPTARRAESIAWSEMRDHGWPWWTSAWYTEKPRT